MLDHSHITSVHSHVGITDRKLESTKMEWPLLSFMKILHLVKKLGGTRPT